jgi:hypothetical protein
VRGRVSSCKNDQIMILDGAGQSGVHHLTPPRPDYESHGAVRRSPGGDSSCPADRRHRGLDDELLAQSTDCGQALLGK